MVSVALMAAIVVLLANTPLGMIQLPIIKATTVHIPVIIGAIILGPMAGAVLGGIFRHLLFDQQYHRPHSALLRLLSVFWPPDLPGIFKAVWISVGCRILIGIVCGWLWIGLKKLKVNAWAALPLTGFVGAMVNTVTVMGSIYQLLAREYRQAQNVKVTRCLGTDHGHRHRLRHIRKRLPRPFWSPPWGSSPSFLFSKTVDFSEGKPMILAIDIGNTNIVLGCIRDRNILFNGEALHGPTPKPRLEHAITLKMVLDLHQIDPKDIDGSIIGFRGASPHRPLPGSPYENHRPRGHGGRTRDQNRPEYSDGQSGPGGQRS